MEGDRVSGGSADDGRSVVGKVAAMLAAFADGPAHSVRDLARRAGLSRSTAYRLAAELAGRRVLERAEDGTYRAGPALRAAAGTAMPAVSSRAPRVMADLQEATGARVLLGLTAGSAIAVYRLADSGPEQALSAPATVPAHATAVGKVLLAFGSDAWVDGVIAGGLDRHTPQTIGSADRLREELADVRRTGIALARGELRPHLCAVAVPVLGPDGRICAALAVRVDAVDRELPLLVPALTTAASCLSRELEDGAGSVDGQVDRAQNGGSGMPELLGSDRRSRPWYGLRINRAGTVSYHRRKIRLGRASAGSIVDMIEDSGVLRVYSGSQLLGEVAL